MKLSSIITIPSTKTEYIAPFFRYLCFFTFSMLLSVSCLTTIAPIPVPTSIRGVAR